MAKLPKVVDSAEPSNTSSPVLSAVRRFNREFLLPPPTINSLFRFFPVIAAIDRSEERRVGKECRSGSSPDDQKKKIDRYTDHLYTAEAAPSAGLEDTLVQTVT